MIFAALDGGSKELSAKYKLRFMPDGIAFAIWGLIYLLLGIYVAYQAIPQNFISSRNEYIFRVCSPCLLIYSVMGVGWLGIFNSDTTNDFWKAQFLIVLMLISALIPMMAFSRTRLNTFEALVCYPAFSLLAGWLTSATILGFVFCLASMGMTKDNGYDDKLLNTYAIIMYWVAELVFVVASFRERNIVYGSVWIWTAFNILRKQRNDFLSGEENKDILKPIELNLNIILAVHTLFLVFLMVRRGMQYKKGQKIGQPESESQKKLLP